MGTCSEFLIWQVVSSHLFKGLYALEYFWNIRIAYLTPYEPPTSFPVFLHSYSEDICKHKDQTLELLFCVWKICNSYFNLLAYFILQVALLCFHYKHLLYYVSDQLMHTHTSCSTFWWIIKQYFIWSCYDPSAPPTNLSWWYLQWNASTYRELHYMEHGPPLWKSWVRFWYHWCPDLMNSMTSDLSCLTASTWPWWAIKICTALSSRSTGTERVRMSSWPFCCIFRLIMKLLEHELTASTQDTNLSLLLTFSQCAMRLSFW